MPLRICVLLWANEGQEQALHRYEDTVLALLDEHGGQVVVRNRVQRQNPQDPVEVQVIHLDSQAAMDAYLQDPRRTAHNKDRDTAIAKTQILTLEQPS